MEEQQRSPSPHVSPTNYEAKNDKDTDMNNKNANVNDASDVDDKESLEETSDKSQMTKRLSL